ncbi:helicase-exonuclease AddAB subunit AddB [Lysinibacillus sp. LZ02]|uniref:helicase-exonuclease AddAB subunit AddB n=1 Tax=Lysinibacillus sp. LZ02 TaxID=3420668 RepID=UPI003D36A219
MSLRIISGRAGVGKTTVIHQEIIDDLKQHPLGHPIFIIVPDQMSFTTEHDLTNKYDVRGIMRAQVLTFKRLAWFILQETGGIAKERIDSFGYRMLLRRILEEHKEEFQLFRQAAGKRGFTQEVEMLLREFSQYDITSESIVLLIAELEQVKASNTLIAKMKDFHIILRELEERIGDSYVDGEGFYPILVEQLQHSSKIKEAHIYIDGFVMFTKRELAIVQQLLALAKRVTIVLPFDDVTAATQPEALFHRAAFSYDKLIQEAMQLGVEVEPRVHLEHTFRFTNDDLLHIEKQFHAPVPVQKQAIGYAQIMEGANRRAEVQGIAREILRLVHEEGVRYRDIGIMYRQADVYDPIIHTTFAQYGIPFFSNEKRPMLHHPLIELTRSALEVIQSNWQYEPIFRGVKTDLFFPLNSDMDTMREQVDQLENFVIAKGIQHNRWKEDKFWVYKRFRTLEKIGTVQTSAEAEMEQLLHRARDMIRTPLLALEKKIKAAENGLELAKAIYEFIDDLKVYEKLQALKEQELEEAVFEFASEHDQVWNGWVNVLDQFALMFGDQQIALEDAMQVLEEGFDALEFSNIPPSLDEVTVATVEFSRFDNMKVVFVIGVNDGVYPMRIDKEGLISDAEREYFDAIDYELAPNSRSKLLQEAFLIYRAMSSPTDRLYLTFPSADEESKGLLPSLYINRLHKLFEVDGKRTLPHTRIYIDPIEELEKEQILHYLRHPSPAVAYLTMQLKHAEVNGELAEEWVALQAFYERHPTWQEVLYDVTKPLYKKNVAETLVDENTAALYGEELSASVSRIEQFFRCPFAHFTSYGLRLEERNEYKLETFAMGDLFHEALRMILTSQDEPPKTYSECLQQARSTVEPLVGVFSYSILESSSRYIYIKEKLIRVVARTLFALTEHAKVSKFKPIVHEKPFGKRDDKGVQEEEQALPALEIELDNRRKMILRGQIDRIDAYEEKESVYLRVVDYKSSSRDIDLNEVYHGLSLQLLTYLDVALKNASLILPKAEKEIIVAPAGMLYVHVHDPLIRLEEVVDEQIRELNRLEKYRMNGLVTSDIDILEAMDSDLPEIKKSNVIPVSLTSKGLGAHSKVVDDTAMPALQQFVIEKHKEAGNEIFAGKTSISPFRLKKKTACDYCSYKAVCQFDPSDGTQAYEDLSAQKPNAIIEKIKKECGLHDSNEAE